MRWLLLFLMWAAMLPVCAQDATDSLVHCARRADSLKLFREVTRLYSLAADRTENERIKAAYYGRAQYALIKAAKQGCEKEAYREALFIGNVSLTGSKMFWADRLATIYLRDGQFDSALLVLNHAEREKVLMRSCGLGMFNSRASYAHKKMLALEGMGQQDSAILKFLPYAFSTQEFWEWPYYTSCHVENSDYHCIVTDFYRLLRKRFSQEQLQSLMRDAASGATYLITTNKISSVCPFEGTFEINFLGQILRPDGSQGFPTAAEANERAKLRRVWLERTILWNLIFDNDRQLVAGAARTDPLLSTSSK